MHANQFHRTALFFLVANDYLVNCAKAINGAGTFDRTITNLIN